MGAESQRDLLELCDTISRSLQHSMHETGQVDPRLLQESLSNLAVCSLTYGSSVLLDENNGSWMSCYEASVVADNLLPTRLGEISRRGGDTAFLTMIGKTLRQKAQELRVGTSGIHITLEEGSDPDDLEHQLHGAVESVQAYHNVASNALIGFDQMFKGAERREALLVLGETTLDLTVTIAENIVFGSRRRLRPGRILGMQGALALALGQLVSQILNDKEAVTRFDSALTSLTCELPKKERLEQVADYIDKTADTVLLVKAFPDLFNTSKSDDSLEL